MNFFQDSEFSEFYLNNDQYKHVIDHLKGLIEDIYKTGSISNLEFHLEEVLISFGLKIPKTDPKIKTKTNKIKDKK